MSLGEKTKCDLSANIAKIDYRVLLSVLRSYMALQINKLKNECDMYFPYYYTADNNTVFKCTVHGKSLDMAVSEIRKTAELIHTLEESNPFLEDDEKRDIIWV